MTVHQSFNKIMEWEGGGRYHEVFGDAGGATKWGVSQRTYPHLDIRNLDVETARGIFRRDYWDKVSADVLPEAIQHAVVDFAFNSGPKRAAVKLQRAINYALGVDNLVEDGQIGPKTVYYAGEPGGHRLLTVYRALRVEFLVGIANRDPSQRKFLYGWLRRANGGRP